MFWTLTDSLGLSLAITGQALTCVQCFLSDLTPFDQDRTDGIITVVQARTQNLREVK